MSQADRVAFIEDVRCALYCSKIISYAQGYMLLRAADRERHWNLNMGAIALMWSGGCIIRSVFLGDIKKAFSRDGALTNLLLDDFFAAAIRRYQGSWRRALVRAIELGIPTPAFSTALAFYDGYRTERLPRQSAAGAARFLWCSHVREGGSAARQVLPH